MTYFSSENYKKRRKFKFVYLESDWVNMVERKRKHKLILFCKMIFK